MNIYEYSECDEAVARPRAPRFATMDEALEWVKTRMPDETRAVLNDVAEAIFNSRRGGSTR